MLRPPYITTSRIVLVLLGVAGVAGVTLLSFISTDPNLVLQVTDVRPAKRGFTFNFRIQAGEYCADVDDYATYGGAPFIGFVLDSDRSWGISNWRGLSPPPITIGDPDSNDTLIEQMDLTYTFFGAVPAGKKGLYPGFAT